MEKTKLEQLQKLLEELKQERLTTIAKDLKYNTVEDLLRDYSKYDLETLDDGDNLLQDVFSLEDTIAGMLSKK